MFLGLRDYQYDGARFMQQVPRCAIWWPMGLGKSLTTLSAFSDNPGQFLPALVTGPKRVIRHVWKDEVEKWGFGFSVAIADGTVKRKKKAIAAGADITCISANSLKYAIDGPWKTFVVDEATLIKSEEATRRVLAKQIADSCDRVIELTGTPTSGTGLIDIWGQIDLLFPGDTCPLGNFWQFGQRYFSFDAFNRPRPRADSEQRVGEIIAPWVFRRDLSEIKMPGLHTDDIVVDMNKKQTDAMAEAELEENGTFVAHRTISSGFRYVPHWSGTIDTEWLGEAKQEALSEIVSQTAIGEPILVFCNFRAEVDRLSNIYASSEVIDGRTSERKAAEIFDRWNAGLIPMLIANCSAMSHGLNLQRGGRRIVWYSLPVAQDVYDQAVGRLWRSGQRDAVFVHRIIAEKSIDQKIAKLLDKKELSQAALMAAVAAAARK